MIPSRRGVSGQSCRAFLVGAAALLGALCCSPSAALADGAGASKSSGGGAGAGAATASGGEAGAAAAPLADDPFTIEVLTFGPGSHPFTRFGHNALRVIDRAARTDIVYNFGTFRFDSPWLIVDFLQGRLRYWLSRSSMRGTVRAYQHENRSIESQELALTPPEKRELVSRLEVNARPENRDYRYDYFTDNCSTRVRDVIDGVSRGRLRASAVGQGTMSLRAHALRMAAGDGPLYMALLIVLGPSADRPVDEWAEDFLPEMLQRTLSAVPAASAGGETRPAPARLVSREQVLFSADRAPPPREPPNRLLLLLGVGLGAGVLMFLLGRAGARHRSARFLFGALLALVGLVVGVVGCFLVGAWCFTPHEVVYRNENILLFAPFALAFWQTPSLTDLLWFVAAGLCGTLGHLCQQRGYQLADITLLQPIGFLSLIWNTLLGYFLFFQQPDFWTFVGAAVIFAACGWVGRADGWRPAAPYAGADVPESGHASKE